MKISYRWGKKSIIYKEVAIKFYEEAARARYISHKEPILPCPYDFSDKAAQEMYIYESKGIGNIVIDVYSNSLNGYAIGKKWLDTGLFNG